MSEEEKKAEAKKAAKKPTAKKAEASTEKKTSKAAKPKKESADKAEAKASEKKSEKKTDDKKAAKPKKEKRERKTDTGMKKQGKVIDDIRLYEVIRTPVVTEKSTMASEFNKVVFKISQDATKTDVKQAVEKLFNVKVEKVNTIAIKGKNKRFRGKMGKRSDIRKAVVTLKEGQSIDVAAGVK